ncbi:hypothetical protein [Lactobacillus bombicola]|uniref:Secreted protein n=1 Tax=Lactobacillus bombicola TaxID=1505723 RepID=A0ABX9LXQ1_9LACO|nr:hypothetical protein [Lactobacillus bombicola]RHW49031.1 hypothetical protein DS833_05880 [Lactobacillus bombicola]RHW53523.1 hypothetical protein DS834_00880 [Lactobacillus bombicola]
MKSSTFAIKVFKTIWLLSVSSEPVSSLAKSSLGSFKITRANATGFMYQLKQSFKKNRNIHDTIFADF